MLGRWRIKKGDQVIVTTGKEKGKAGEVIRVSRKSDRVFVSGLNMVTKHKKRTATSEGGLVRQESGIHVSNVMHRDPTTQKPTRIGVKTTDDGLKIRFAKSSGASIEGGV